MNDIFDDYLSILKSAGSEEESRHVLDAAKFGSQRAYDAVVEYYVSHRHDNEPNRAQTGIDPSVAFLIATDKASRFKNKRLFLEGFKTFKYLPASTSLAHLNWKTNLLNHREPSFVSERDTVFASHLINLIFHHEDNRGIDKEFGRESKDRFWDLIFLRGMAFIRGKSFDYYWTFFEAESFMGPLGIYDIPDKKIRETIDNELSETNFAANQIHGILSANQGRMNFEAAGTASLSQSNKFEAFRKGLLRDLERIWLLHDVLDRSALIADGSAKSSDPHYEFTEFGDEAERHSFVGKLSYRENSRPIMLTYAGKHILAQLITIAEVLNGILESFSILPDTEPDFDWSHKIAFHSMSPNRRGNQYFKDNIARIIKSANLGIELKSMFPELIDFCDIYKTKRSFPPVDQREYWEAKLKNVSESIPQMDENLINKLKAMGFYPRQ